MIFKKNRNKERIIIQFQIKNKNKMNNKEEQISI